MDKRFLSPQEVAAYLGLSHSEINRRCRTGELTAIKIGKRRWGIDPQCLEEFEEEITEVRDLRQRAVGET